jgi:hypothetical protein
MLILCHPALFSPCVFHQHIDAMKCTELYLHGGRMAFKDTVLTLIKIHLSQTTSSEQQQTICFEVDDIWTCFFTEKKQETIYFELEQSAILTTCWKILHSM